MATAIGVSSLHTRVPAAAGSAPWRTTASLPFAPWHVRSRRWRSCWRSNLAVIMCPPLQPLMPVSLWSASTDVRSRDHRLEHLLQPPGSPSALVLGVFFLCLYLL